MNSILKRYFLKSTEKSGLLGIYLIMGARLRNSYCNEKND